MSPRWFTFTDILLNIGFWWKNVNSNSFPPEHYRLYYRWNPLISRSLVKMTCKNLQFHWLFIISTYLCVFDMGVVWLIKLININGISLYKVEGAYVSFKILLFDFAYFFLYLCQFSFWVAHYFVPPQALMKCQHECSIFCSNRLGNLIADCYVD